MADDALPPDDNQGPMLLASSLPFYALALICFSVRFGSRLHSKFKLTAADYTCAIAMACKTVAIGFMVVCIENGFGRHSVYITNRAVMVNYNLGVFLAGTGASAFARISIACLLLQFTISRLWRAIIWAAMALNFLDFLAFEIVQLVSCRTVLALQVTTSRGTQCLTPTAVRGFTYAAITIAMLSDLACAAIPIVVIRRLPRSTVEKTIISILMATCLLASACGIAKLYYMATFDFTSPDGFYLMLPEFFWSRMEEAIIITAACLPLLKAPAERLLRRCGLLAAAAARAAPSVSQVELPARRSGGGEAKEPPAAESTATKGTEEADSWRGPAEEVDSWEGPAQARAGQDDPERDAVVAAAGQ